MNSLIKRYVAEVSRHLLEKDREEVARELESNILDMLPPAYSEEDVKKILNAMGNPCKLADTYRAKGRYLIGPDTFDLYLYVLKLVAVVLASVTTGISLIDLFLTSVPTTASVITSILSNVAEALSGAFLSVTITFAIIDFFQVKIKDDETWTVEELPQQTEPQGPEIKKSEGIASILGSAVFIGILAGMLYKNPDLLAVYGLKNPPIPLFQAPMIKPFILVLIAFFALSFFKGILELITGRWTKPLMVYNGILSFGFSLFILYTLNRQDLMNPDCVQLLPNGMETWVQITRLASLLVVVFMLLDIGLKFLRVWRSSQKQI